MMQLFHLSTLFRVIIFASIEESSNAKLPFCKTFFMFSSFEMSSLKTKRSVICSIIISSASSPVPIAANGLISSATATSTATAVFPTDQSASGAIRAKLRHCLTLTCAIRVFSILPSVTGWKSSGNSPIFLISTALSNTTM